VCIDFTTGCVELREGPDPEQNTVASDTEVGHSRIEPPFDVQRVHITRRCGLPGEGQMPLQQGVHVLSLRIITGKHKSIAFEKLPRLGSVPHSGARRPAQPEAATFSASAGSGTSAVLVGSEVSAGVADGSVSVSRSALWARAVSRFVFRT
jgi:hypothetical protein